MKNLLWIAALLVPAIVIAQLPTGSVSGEIRTREGQPAAGVRVSAMAVPDAGAPASGTALVSIGTTDSQGRYKLENVIPGRYYITAGFVELPTYYPGVSAASGATVINVSSGTSVTGINFSVTNSTGVTVSGRVRRASGTGGLSGQFVGLLGDVPPAQQATTAADGSFQFLKVPPGNYRVSASSGIQPLTVTVNDKDIAGLEIVVSPTTTITGSVVVEGNGLRPRLNLQFSPFKGTGRFVSTSTQTDGTFRTSITEGDYHINWSNLPVGYEIKSITAGTVDILTNPLKVSVDAPPGAIKLLLAVDGNPWVKVSGRVVNPGSNRTLTLSGPNVDQIQLTVNPDGTFEIPQALPGTYQIRPNPSGLAAAPSLVTQLVSVVIPNQDTTNLVIALPLTKVVSGIVVNSSGAGFRGVLSLNYSQTSGNSSSSGSRSFITQTDGTFSLEVPEGSDLRLTVNAQGSNVKSATYGTTDLMRENLRVSAKDTAELRVVLDTTSTTTVVGGVVGGTTLTSIGGVVGGVPGGIVTSSISSIPPPPPPPPPQQISSSSATTTVNRIAEAVAKPNLVTSVPPAYPALAATARVQGSVVLQLEITTEGRVQNVSALSGSPLLTDAAIQAVRQWTYKPFVLNGQAIPVTTTATVIFTLP